MDNPTPPKVRQLHFYKGRLLVLTVEDLPGLLFSTATPSPSGAPSHDFVNARAYDPYSENELGELLRKSGSFDHFVELMIHAGYNAISTPHSAPLR